MSRATPQQDGVFPFFRPASDNSDFNAMTFLVQSMLAKLNTATLVRVVAVHGGGGSAGAGTVDVQPLVNLVDGSGSSWSHTTIYGLPFFRLQGGANAFVVDPVAEDIGLAVFCDRDIASVKLTSKAALPSSARRFSMSDGVYLGGWCATAAPSRAVILDANGCAITCNTKIDGDMNLNGGVLKVNGVQVVKAQQATVTPSTGTLGDTTRAVNDVILRLQAHGLVL